MKIYPFGSIVEMYFLLSGVQQIISRFVVLGHKSYFVHHLQPKQEQLQLPAVLFDALRSNVIAVTFNTFAFFIISV
jgi:hypothetical protein